MFVIYQVTYYVGKQPTLLDKQLQGTKGSR